MLFNYGIIKIYTEYNKSKMGVSIMIIHTVCKNETLESIAEKYCVNPVTLAVNNGVPKSGKLATGQSLIIVYPKLIHTVKEGESLFIIADLYGVCINQIYRNNLILRGNPTICPGMNLIIEIENSFIGEYMTAGYAYPFIGIELLDTSLPAMSGLIPFTYGFTPDGELVPLNDEQLIFRAKVYGIRYVMHLSSLTSDGNFSSELAGVLLNNKNLWNILLKNIILNMRRKGYCGLDVDFEFLGAENAIHYAEFIHFLTINLNKIGFPVMVALAPKISSNQPGILYEGHNYKALGNAANSVLLMTYEWGYTFGPPMAVSPIKSVSRVVEYALTQIKASKIFLGISNYGYDFITPYERGVSKANSISTTEAIDLALQYNSEIMYDEEVQSPYFNYTKDNVEHIVWYEDAKSLNSRLNLLKEYCLKGAIYWNLMRENPQNLALINSIISLQRLNLF